MKIFYKSNKLEKSLTIPNEIFRTYGIMAKKINQRMKELSAANTLAVMKTILAANCHELKGERTGQLAVNVSGNWRIIFEPNHSPMPTKEDGGLDWQKVTDIRVLEVTDYH
jgi:plasmid maintenance system killer protein